MGFTALSPIMATLRTILTGALLAAASPDVAAQPGAEILWDTYGVPHIHARSDGQLGYGFGWAQMQAHANLVLELYGEARGRSAEYWGDPSGQRQALDLWTRRMGVARGGSRWYAQQEPSFRAYLDAFVRGMNDWAQSHRDQIADSMEVVLPVTARDVLAHGQRVITTAFVTSPDRVSGTVRAWERGGIRAADAAAAELEAAEMRGSNAWAIAPAKSASGKAMLVANPHLPWASFYTWFEAQLVAPGLNLTGATLVGSPIITIGFNDDIAWTHTVNTHDGQDLYELILDGDGYRLDGARKRFTTRAETLLVKGGDGRKTPTVVTMRESVHGPVVGEKDGKALALRVVGLDRGGAWQQWWEMGRATNKAQFLRASQAMQVPMFTSMYADRHGEILHLFGGLTPVRARGGWEYWQGIVRGDSTSTLWTKTHTFAELPLLVNPAGGWLQNANDPPWTTTIPLQLDPARYPAYMAPRGMAFRPQRSARLLAETGKISFDDMVARKHDTRMELADRLLDDLGAAVAAHGDADAKAAMAVLTAWDRTADAASRGGVLFGAWWREVSRTGGPGTRGIPAPFATAWDAQRALETPDGLADPAAAAMALSRAARGVRELHGALDVPWGEVNRLRRDAVDLPANGGSGQLGIFRVVEFSAPEREPQGTAAFGDSFVAAVEFATPLRAEVLIGYGNWSQPGSKHRVDQLPLFARKALRPAWRSRAEVEANLERREIAGGR